MPGWRNWQTRWIQNPVPAREWGFEAPSGYQIDSFKSTAVRSPRRRLIDNKLPHKLTCLVDICKYPRTCEWNNCCMEGEMKKSMDAKKNIEEKDSERSDLKNKDA